MSKIRKDKILDERTGGIHMLFEDVVSKVEVDTEKFSYEKELGIVDIQSIRFQESFSKNITICKVFSMYR